MQEYLINVGITMDLDLFIVAESQAEAEEKVLETIIWELGQEPDRYTIHSVKQVK